MPLFFAVAARAFIVLPENALVTLRGNFNIVAQVVSRDPLPCDAPLLHAGLNMPVSLAVTGV